MRRAPVWVTQARDGAERAIGGGGVLAVALVAGGLFLRHRRQQRFRLFGLVVGEQRQRLLQLRVAGIGAARDLGDRGRRSAGPVRPLAPPWGERPILSRQGGDVTGRQAADIDGVAAAGDVHRRTIVATRRRRLRTGRKSASSRARWSPGNRRPLVVAVWPLPPVSVLVGGGGPGAPSSAPPGPRGVRRKGMRRSPARSAAPRRARTATKIGPRHASGSSSNRAHQFAHEQGHDSEGHPEHAGHLPSFASPENSMRASPVECCRKLAPPPSESARYGAMSAPDALRRAGRPCGVPERGTTTRHHASVPMPPTSTAGTRAEPCGGDARFELAELVRRADEDEIDRRDAAAHLVRLRS